MADNLYIFGEEYTDVAGIIATDDYGDDLVFTRGNAFVIHLIYDDNTGYYVPDKTSAEIAAASSAGRELAAMAYNNELVSWSYFMGNFSYTVAEYTSTTVGTYGYSVSAFSFVNDNVSQLWVNEYPTIDNQNKTVTPTASQQSITADSGYTGLGTVTVNGDADLVASNIVSGVQIFNITGNVVLQNYYTGSSAPASSLGSNGDLYLQS